MTYESTECDRLIAAFDRALAQTMLLVAARMRGAGASEEEVAEAALAFRPLLDLVHGELPLPMDAEQIEEGYLGSGCRPANVIPLRRLVASGKEGPAFGARGGVEMVVGRGGLRSGALDIPEPKRGA